MLDTILTIIGFILISILIILLIRFVLFLHKVIGNINSKINTITDAILDIKKDISSALSEIENFLTNTLDTIDKTNEVVSKMKKVTDTIFVPITGIKKITSNIGKFVEVFRGRLKLNKKNE